SVLSSGFQGYFPAGLLVGSIADEAPEFDGQFLNVPITLAADFRAIRYVQIAAPSGEAEINGLTHSDSQQSP
ncbi:MAG: rod shape-determining protein MreC, partial [Flavobacteriales bacterium]